KAAEEARRVRLDEQQLEAQIDALRTDEAQELKRNEEAEARLRSYEEARQSAQARATGLAEQEEQLENEMATLRAAEEEHVLRLQQIQAQVRECANRNAALVERDRDEMQPVVELIDETQVKASESFVEPSGAQVKEIATADEP